MITPFNTDALYKLYPNVIRTVGDIAYDSQGNEVFYDENAINTKASQDLQIEQATKASALAKLTALGLTQDEVKALIG